MDILNVISLLTGVALFLFGMNVMGDGLKKVAGSKLELILYRLSGTPLKGILLGTGVTAVIQSSSATSVMVVGFVNSGMMKVKQAIGIIMGSIFGTSITGWILCLSSLDNGGSGWARLLSTTTLTGIIAVIGIVLKLFCKSKIKKHLGDILMGFAVLMCGMAMMSSAVAPLKEEPAFVQLLTDFKNPFLGILVGIVFTAILQSASASVGILQALAITGVIDFRLAFPILLGCAVGAAVPVLLSAIGTVINGKRTAFVYLLVSFTGSAIIGIVFYAINAFHPFSFMDVEMDAVKIALVNSLFRLLTVLLLAPFISLMERIVNTLFRDNPEDLEDTADIDRLEDRFIPHPALAIEQSRSAMNSMIEKTAKNLSRSLELMDDYRVELFDKINAKEEVIDRYEDKLGTYLVKITQNELNRNQNLEISKFLHTISDIERIADHAVNIAGVAQEIYEKHLVFSDEAMAEIGIIRSAITEIVHISLEAFQTENVALAERVEPLEEVIDDLCDSVKNHHISRVQTGNCTLGQGFVFNDLLSNYERIADHCSNIAVAMIELNVDAFDTHEYLNVVKKEKPENFSKYLEMFREKYKLA